MKTIFKITALFLLLLTLVSCTEEGKHDGRYFTSVQVFGTDFCDVDYTIQGNIIYIDNSITGKSKITCQQYVDRIEYEENGSIKIMTILPNGDINVNGQIVLQKVD